MPYIRSFYALFFLVALTVCSGRCGPAWGLTVSGRVADREGEAVVGALVEFTDNEGPSRVFSDSTDGEGRYEVVIGDASSVGVETEHPIPAGFALFANYPNPFNPSTTIPYQLARKAHVRLTIFNVLGQVVRTLVDGQQDAGPHSALWDGRDSVGIGLGAGAYTCQLGADGWVQTRKMVMIDGDPAALDASQAAAASKPSPAARTRGYTVAITGRGVLPYSAGDLLLSEDVEMDFQVERTHIVWLGHASIRIDVGEVIYIDPWKLKRTEPADLVLITHSHGDHCSPEDVARIQTDSTVIVAPKDCTANLTGDVRVVAPGDTLTVGSVTLEAVPAYNTTKSFHPKSNGWVGYVVTVDGMRVYHAGDTDLIPEMGNLRADVALLPVGGTYTMTAQEAAEAADLIKPKLAIPIHFGDIVGSAGDARLFAELCQVPVEILEPEE